jgi:hypothetical protein
MKQKYTIAKDEVQDRMLIKEFAELDKEMLSMLCKESYDETDVRSAAHQSIDTLIARLRTRSLFPTRFAAEQIAEGVARYLKSGGPVDVLIDDADCLAKKEKTCAVVEDMSGNGEDIDDLLEDDVDGSAGFEADIAIDKLNPAIKIADEDSVEIEGEI